MELKPLSATPQRLPEPTDAMRKVAEEFEASMLSELLAPMFDALKTDGLGGGGAGEQMFRPMLVQNYAQSMAQAGGVGIADAVLAEMIRLQTGVR
jgi:Rod binding domain-containing protein